MRARATPAPVAIDDKSGFKVKLSALAKDWDGAMTVRKRIDDRQPQDFVRGVPDRQDLPYARPEAPDVFLSAPVTPADL